MAECRFPACPDGDDDPYQIESVELVDPIRFTLTPQAGAQDNRETCTQPSCPCLSFLFCLPTVLDVMLKLLLTTDN